MRRTTVSLPDGVAAALEREARRRRVSLSAVVCEAVVAHLHLAGDRPRRLPIAGLGESGHASTARDLEDVVAAEWARDRGR